LQPAHVGPGAGPRLPGSKPVISPQSSSGFWQQHSLEIKLVTAVTFTEHVNNKYMEQIDSLNILRNENEEGLHESDPTCPKTDRYSPICNARLPVRKNILLVGFYFLRDSKRSHDATTMDRLKHTHQTLLCFAVKLCPNPVSQNAHVQLASSIMLSRTKRQMPQRTITVLLSCFAGCICILSINLMSQRLIPISV